MGLPRKSGRLSASTSQATKLPGALFQSGKKSRRPQDIALGRHLMIKIRAGKGLNSVQPSHSRFAGHGLSPRKKTHSVSSPILNPLARGRRLIHICHNPGDMTITMEMVWRTWASKRGRMGMAPRRPP